MGLGNSKLVGFSSNREASLMLTDAIFDKYALEMLTGNLLSTAAKVIPYHETLVSSASDKLTLTKTPVLNSSSAITSLYKLNADGTNGTLYPLGVPASTPISYSISSKEITLAAATVEGTSFRAYYDVTTDATATTMSVTSDAFGGSFKVVLDVLVRDEYTKADYAGTLIIPNGKFEDNFSFGFEASGEPKPLDLKIEVLKDPLSVNMWQLVIHDEALII